MSFTNYFSSAVCPSSCAAEGYQSDGDLADPVLLHDILLPANAGASNRLSPTNTQWTRAGFHLDEFQNSERHVLGNPSSMDDVWLILVVEQLANLKPQYTLHPRRAACI